MRKEKKDQQKKDQQDQNQNQSGQQQPNGQPQSGQQNQPGQQKPQDKKEQDQKGNQDQDKKEKNKDINGDKNNCKIAFVGHSMGCYVILKLLQDKALAAAHTGSILAHPTLENLALTKKGTMLVNFFALKLDLLAQLVACGVEKFVPKSMILDVAKWSCSREFVSSASSIVIDSIAQLVDSTTLIALIGMAKSELASIGDLNHRKLIKPHASKLKLIYAIDDHWVNAGNRLELAQLYPELHIEEQQTMHAFIMDPEAVSRYSIKFGMLIEDFFE